MQQFISLARRVRGKALHILGLGKSRHLYRPTIRLRSVFHGTEYGGWTLFPDVLSASSVVYSFGIGEDASFDRDVMQTYGVSLFAFDPTPRSIQWVAAQQWPAQFVFHPYGIAANDGTMQFYPPSDPAHVSYSLLARDEDLGSSITVQMLRLESITKMLGHSKIDLLKMDIEGSEYQVIPDILATPGLNIRQILVEFHHFFPDVSPEMTKETIQQLLMAGYELFHVAPNGNEYSFIKAA